MPNLSAAETLDLNVTRRDFLVKACWGIGAAYLVGALGGMARYLFPNVLYEPYSRFTIGKPSNFATPNTVYDTFINEHRTWVVRDEGGLYAVLAKCMHLGCTPRWFLNEKRFKCPCHGSNYDIKADVIAGPAPRPMNRCKIWLDDKGLVNVDNAILLSTEDNDRRRKPPFYLNLTAS